MERLSPTLSPSIFPTTKTVYHLKDLIKAKKAIDFQDVDANKLTLWRVSIPDDNLASAITIDALDVETKLNNLRTRLSILFPEGPDENTYILVQRPPPVHAPAARKRDLLEAFPNGLPYQRPAPLVETTGSTWTYQPDPTLYDTLRSEIKDHYHYFTKGMIDQTYMLLYLFLCGAGTGKSRNAQELHQSAVSCLTEDDQELRNRIAQAWVFHVSFENGTRPLKQEVDPIYAIGARMLL
ncbi:hypothetical protein BGX24_012316 [Mortierella sp. AD032]|nr:hypothetical protein BGX24_012316 [Mortierella sp. AD032]